MDGSTSEDTDKGGGAGRNDNTVPSQNDTSTKTGKDQVTPKESLTAGSTDELTKVDTREKSSVEDMANDGSDCNLDASFVIIDNDDCLEKPDNNDGANCPDNEGQVNIDPEQQHIDKENADDDENLKQMVPGMPPKYLAEDNLQKESTGGQLLSMPVGGEAAGHKKQKTEENASNKPDLKEANPGIVKQIEETPAPEKQSEFDNSKESNQEKRPSSKGGSAMKEQFELTKLGDNIYVINCGPIEFTYTANSTNVRIKNDFLLDDKVVYKLIIEDGEIHKKSMKEIKDASTEGTAPSSNNSSKNDSKNSDTERSHVEAHVPDKPEKLESNDEELMNDLANELSKISLDGEGACKPISQKKQSHVVLITSQEDIKPGYKHIVIHAPHLKTLGSYAQFAFRIVDMSDQLRFKLIMNDSAFSEVLAKMCSNLKISLQQGVLIVGISSDEQHLTQETASKYASDIVDKIHEVTRVFVCMDRKLQAANPQKILSKIQENRIAKDGYLLVELEPNTKVLWTLCHSNMHNQTDEMISQVIAGSKETEMLFDKPYEMPYVFHHMFDDKEFKDEFQNEFENVGITHSKICEENSVLITLRGESMESLQAAKLWINNKSDNYYASMSFPYQDDCGSSEEIEEYLKMSVIDDEVKYEINEKAHKVWFYSCTLSQDKLLQRTSQAKKCILNNKIRTSIVMSTESDGEDAESHVADKSPSKLPDKPEEVKETGAKPKNIPPKPTPRKNIQNLSKQEPPQQVMDREAIDNSYKNGKTESLVWNKENMQDSKDHGIIKVKLSKGKSMDDVCLSYKSKLGKHIVVYIEDHEEGLLIYRNYEDALKVYKQLDKSRFYLMTKMTLHNFCQRVDDVKWKSLGEKDKTDLEKKLKSKGVTVNEKEGKRSINAPTAYQIKLAKQIIDSFISDIATECTIKDVSSLVWNTVHVIYQGRIDKLEKDCGREIAFSEEKSEVCFPWSIKGNISDLKKALNDLKEHQIEDIAIKQEELSKVEDACEHVETQNPNVGGCKYDKARKTVFIYGETFEVFTKLKHQWEIKIGRRKQTARGNRGAAKVVTQETAEEGKIDVPALASKKMPIEQKTFDTDIGIKVIIYQGSILNLPVECIVNAANGGLSHDIGVARVIADAAGKDLERESKNYIKKYGELSDGSACSTTAGNIYNYKYVIHTVGPRWSEYSRNENGRQRCEKALVDAVKNAFYEADSRKMKSIALPAISSAIFGVPINICVRQYVSAVEKYCAERMGNYTGTLSEIHFVDIKSDVVLAIQDAFTRFFSPVPGTSESSNTLSADTGSTQNEDRKLPEPLMYERDLNTHVFLFTGNNENDGLLLFRENIECITQTKAVIVPVNEKGKGGHIESLILDKVDELSYKQEFAREKQLAFSRGRSIGDVIRVPGYGCGFAFVLCIVYPRNEQMKSYDERKNSLGNAIQSILNTADKDREIHSIALPMFGIDSKNDEDVRLFCSIFVEQYRILCEKKIRHSNENHLTVKIICQADEVFESARKTFVDYVKQFKDDYNKDETGDSDINDSETSKVEDNSIIDASLGPCVICMDTITEPKTIQCGHTFCTDCIDQQFQYKKQCPTCFQVCGVITGDQPVGTMDVYTNKYKHQPGYEEYGTIIITYKFPDGYQQDNHPTPGQFYKGITRSAYLPDNSEGRKVLKMLNLAFKRKLTFTIGNSRTTGQQGVITWNDIHHKTDHRAYTQFGYPDPTYLERVKDELAAKGITEADIENT
ncbi:E3 ubiquitin-protein ligase dtx3l [Mactra antiquata]